MLYVANHGGGSVTVFSMAASGDPVGVGVDPTAGELFVANQLINTIAVYGRTPSGNAAPERTLIGTDLSWPALLAANW